MKEGKNTERLQQGMKKSEFENEVFIVKKKSLYNDKKKKKREAFYPCQEENYRREADCL